MNTFVQPAVRHNLTNAEAVKILEDFAETQGYDGLSLEFFEYMQSDTAPRHTLDNRTRAAYYQTLRGFQAMFATVEG